jgi:ethanolamine transporter EutH
LIVVAVTPGALAWFPAVGAAVVGALAALPVGAAVVAELDDPLFELLQADATMATAPSVSTAARPL